MPLRVYVDYNTVDENGKVEIFESLQPELVSQLVHNMPIVIYDSDNLEFDAIAVFDERYQGWFAIPDLSTRRDLPPLNDNQS